MTDPRVADLRRLVAAHVPGDAREAVSRQRMRGYLAWLAAPFDQTADPTHVTASAIVLGPGSEVLLHRHRRLGVWLQPGGHVDGAEAPAAAAVREVHEETGVVATHPPEGPQVVHLDVHEGPRGHVHLDLRYLLVVTTTPRPDPAPGESREVAWVPSEQAIHRGDASLAAAVGAGLRQLARRTGSAADGTNHPAR